jgi:squalene-hopene/tetraprenyl-beta-curcumene cyclase
VHGLSRDEIAAAYRQVADALLRQARPEGHWTGELSASALSTATAVAALAVCRRQSPPGVTSWTPLIERGIQWLVEHQNHDGGWGDTVLSISNISTTMLARAAFALGTDGTRFSHTVTMANNYIDRHGGVAAVKARYGKDRTFSAPILTQCALAGLVDWNEVAELPFELACLPHSFYKTVRLPVVSYALPALIAIGQVRHGCRPSGNPILRRIRQAAIGTTLRKLQAIQPASGGFLEAVPLTSFVTMSLAHLGLQDHPVVQKGLDFLLRSSANDGSWPIDVNLATWVTTLAVNGLDDETLPERQQRAIADWLLKQQMVTVHPYTQAEPGGWAWTDLPGGVPDADDTPGAILALLKLSRCQRSPERCDEAVSRAVNWLLNLQNADGGWPTFCRGWGALPFDRSSCDLTAHVLRAFVAWRQCTRARSRSGSSRQFARIDKAVNRGLSFLSRHQRPDGSWLPLWFGNQHAPNDENPLYGTARVLLAYRDLERLTDPAAERGLQWLIGQQNDDGGWGGMRGLSSSTEETALAVEALSTGCEDHEAFRERGLQWLLRRIEEGTYARPTPIGFYFAKLWYFERLYPLVFTVSALKRALTAPAASEAENVCRAAPSTAGSGL